MKFAASSLLFGAVAFLGSSAEAQNYGGRQYYTFWQQSTTSEYYYREYYFRTTTTSEYTVHQVHWYPNQPNYYYYYNPQSQVYWGRVPVDRDGKALYSLLKPEDRKGDLEDIPESAFPEPSEPPPIPGAKDDTKIAMPPEDPPPQAARAKADES